MRSLGLLTAMLATALPVRADIYSHYVSSIEYLVDSNEIIVQATVVREKDEKTKDWTTRLDKVNRVLKSAEGATVPSFSNLAAIQAEGTNDVLLFGCRTQDKKAVKLSYCVFLNQWKVPASAAERTSAYQDIAQQTSAWQDLVFFNPRCIVIDKQGNVLVDPAAVVDAVSKRVKLNPKRINNGGCYVKRGELLEDHQTDYNVLVPLDPEFKE